MEKQHDGRKSAVLRVTATAAGAIAMRDRQPCSIYASATPPLSVATAAQRTRRPASER